MIQTLQNKGNSSLVWQHIKGPAFCYKSCEHVIVLKFLLLFIFHYITDIITFRINK